MLLSNVVLNNQQVAEMAIFSYTKCIHDKVENYQTLFTKITLQSIEVTLAAVVIMRIQLFLYLSIMLRIKPTLPF